MSVPDDLRAAVMRRQSAGTKAGKELAAEMEVLRIEDPLRSLPGMPADYWPALEGGTDDRTIYRPGLAVHAEAVYVTWGTTRVADKVDESVWERVKLSEYHAILEAESEAA